MSPKYSLNKEDGFKILEVIAWTALSSIVAVSISIVAALDVPAQYAFLVPVVNVFLYTVQRFVAGKLG